MGHAASSFHELSSTRADDTSLIYQGEVPMRNSHISRRTLLALSLAGNLPAYASTWPDQTVTIVNPYGPASTTDLVGRLMAEKLQKSTGKSFIVESKPGAGGLIGVGQVARGLPHGRTFALATGGPLVHDVVLRKKMPYNPSRDLAPLTIAVRQPQLLIASNKIDVDTLVDLLKHFKKGGEYNYAYVGTGSLSHLLMVKITEVSKVALEPINYPGGADALMAVMRGDAHIACLPAFIALAAARSGRVKLLGISSEDRSAFFPKLPTLVEQGYDGMVGYGWIGAVAPAVTPEPILASMRKSVVESLKHQDVVEKLALQMIEVVALGDAHYNDYVRKEKELWWPLIQRNQIIID